MSKGMFDSHSKSKSPSRLNGQSCEQNLPHLQTDESYLNQDTRLSHNRHISRPISKHTTLLHNITRHIQNLIVWKRLVV